MIETERMINQPIKEPDYIIDSFNIHQAPLNRQESQRDIASKLSRVHVNKDHFPRHASVAAQGNSLN